MANAVFILGAGASKQGGAPLMADFLDQAEALWRTNMVSEKAEFFKTVFFSIGRMQVVHSKAQLDLGNIESVFNALVMARILRKFPGDESFSPEDAEIALRQVIATTLEKTLQFPVLKGRIVAPKPYESFANLIAYLRNDANPNRSVAVLTFNYDMAADYALYRSNLGPDYCLTEERRNGIPLLKLHGSMNWGVCTQCQTVVPWHLSEFFQKFRHQFLDDIEKAPFDIWSAFDSFTHCNHRVEPLPFLVPPTWNKTDHHEAIGAVWQRAAKELTDAEDVFIIGYSLPATDAFFRMLYAIGVVGDLPLKRIWVYNPDQTGEVQERFRRLIGHGAENRFRYIPMSFADAITHIKQEYPPRTR